jgi:hypothetical protein
MAPGKFTYCVGSPSFKPDEIIDDSERQQRANEMLAKDDLYSASRVLLDLPEPDTYTYHAMTSVKLAQVQHIVGLGGANGLHSWYHSEDGTPVS